MIIVRQKLFIFFFVMISAGFFLMDLSWAEANLAGEIYAIENAKKIVRVDLGTGKKEVVYTADGGDYEGMWAMTIDPEKRRLLFLRNKKVGNQYSKYCQIFDLATRKIRTIATERKGKDSFSGIFFGGNEIVSMMSPFFYKDRIGVFIKSTKMKGMGSGLLKSMGGIFSSVKVANPSKTFVVLFDEEGQVVDRFEVTLGFEKKFDFASLADIWAYGFWNGLVRYNPTIATLGNKLFFESFDMYAIKHQKYTSSPIGFPAIGEVDFDKKTMEILSQTAPAPKEILPEKSKTKDAERLAPVRELFGKASFRDRSGDLLELPQGLCRHGVNFIVSEQTKYQEPRKPPEQTVLCFNSWPNFGGEKVDIDALSPKVSVYRNQNHGFWGATLSPEGTMILYQGRPDISEIFVFDLLTKKEKLILPDNYASPVWGKVPVRDVTGGTRQNQKEKQTADERDYLGNQVSSGVKLTVSIDGAEIYIDEGLVGISPIKGGLKLSPGLYQISVKKEGFKEWVRKIRVISGTISEINVELNTK